MIAKLIKDCSMFDEYGLEGGCVTWDLIVQHLVVPCSKKILQLKGKIGRTMVLVVLRLSEQASLTTT